MNGSVFAIATALLLPATASEHNKESSGERAVEAHVVKTRYQPLEPIWVRIEVMNRTNNRLRVGRLKISDPHALVLSDVARNGKQAEETAYKKGGKVPYISGGHFFEDAIDISELSDNEIRDSAMKIIEPGKTLTIRLLANLAHDMSLPGNYSMRFGVPYSFEDEDGRNRSEVAWTDPIVVEVLDQLPAPPEDD